MILDPRALLGTWWSRRAACVQHGLSRGRPVWRAGLTPAVRKRWRRQTGEARALESPEPTKQMCSWPGRAWSRGKTDVAVWLAGVVTVGKAREGGAPVRVLQRVDEACHSDCPADMSFQNILGSMDIPQARKLPFLEIFWTLSCLFCIDTQTAIE